MRKLIILSNLILIVLFGNILLNLVTGINQQVESTVDEEHTEESKTANNSFLLNDSLSVPVLAETTANNETNLTEETYANFALEIPSINLKHDIWANTDPRYKEEYIPVLDQYIAHGKFTLLPDEATKDGNVYLFAHRSNYDGKQNGFFANLDKIKPGDIAYIYYNGITYTYSFRTSKIVEPSETSVYTSQSDTPTLTMQTCNNGLKERLILWWDLVEVR